MTGDSALIQLGFGFELGLDSSMFGNGNGNQLELNACMLAPTPAKS